MSVPLFAAPAKPPAKSSSSATAHIRSSTSDIYSSTQDIVGDRIWQIDGSYNTQPFSVFDARWTVPSLPSASDGQSVYLYAGLESGSSTCTVRSVLAYGAAGYKTSWSIASWYGCDGSYTMTAPVAASAGDTIESYISDGVWTIRTDDATSNTYTTASVSGINVGGSQYYAQTAISVASMTACDDYPASGSTSFGSFYFGSTSYTMESTAITPGTQECGEDVYASTSSATLYYYQVPVITSVLTATGTVYSSFDYQITASSNPASYNASNLPSGLAIDTSDGEISGTPTVSGTTYVTLDATNDSGTGSAILTLYIAPDAVPVITSTLTVTGQTGSSFSYQITAENSPTSYSASNLPDGLSIDASGGVISGTPIAAATTYVTIGATNDIGTSSATLTIIINSSAPVITSADTASGAVGVAFSYQITGSNAPTSFGASNLPSGLGVDTGSGIISGTPTSVGVTTATISVTNASGTGYGIVTITIAPLEITSTLAVTGVFDEAFSYQIETSSNPTSYYASGLPSGLSINTGSGLISGTPTAVGTADVTIGATNSLGSGSATLALTVAPLEITSSTVAYGGVDASFWYRISGQPDPVAFAASGLPSGLSADTGSGVISGTPASTGTTSVTISATNADGTVSTTIAVKVLPLKITSATAAVAGVNSSFSYQIAANKSVTSYSASGMPSWMSLDSGGGVLSGVPTAIGTSTVTVSATGSSGSGAAIVIVTVQPLKITSALADTAYRDIAFSYQIEATNSPTSFTATNLPDGLSINSSGLISGTPTTSGTYYVALGATNSTGTGTATLVLTVANPPALYEVSSYPNPFRPLLGEEAHIHYRLGSASGVSIKIYNPFGRLVWQYGCAPGQSGCQAGENEVVWKGVTGDGKNAGRHIYIGVIDAGGMTEKVKIGVL